MKHNKKRNIGIMYELLLRHISNCLVEGNMKGVKVATRIIEKRLNKDTELYKEFRLFNALANSSVNSTELAVGILSEAKKAVTRFDSQKIEKEKSALIRDINHKIKDDNFYYRSIPNYVDLASVQNLIAEWKKGDKSNLKRLVESEKKIVNLLITEKVVNDIVAEKKNLDVSQTNRLIEKIMVEKINSKYGSLLLEQKEIIKNYALYNSDTGTSKQLSIFLSNCKDSSLKILENYQLTNDNNYVAKKIQPVKEKILKLDPTNISDDSIMKFLTLTKMISEIKESENV